MRVLFCAATALLLASGCSKSPAAPPLPGPSRFVVFTSDRDRAAGSYRNYFATLDGGGASRFSPRSADTVVDRHPSITQDGRVLAYEGSDGRGRSQDIFLYNRSSNALTDDPNVNTTFDEIDPYISLDGTRLVFVRDSLGIKRIRLYNLTTSKLIPLPGLEAPGFSDWEPALDAQGRRIVFTTNRSGSSDVMVYQVSLQTLLSLTTLAHPSASDIEPAISGDGRFIAFASNRTGGQGDYDIFMLDLSNPAVPVVLPSNANSPQSDRDPTLSQDGSNLVFVSTRPGGEGGSDLWNLNRIAAVISQPTGESSAGEDLDPVVVWP